MLDALGNETGFAYDGSNRLLRQTSSDGTLDKSYSYDANGRIASTTDGGVRADYNYDARGNVSAKQSSDAAQGYEAQRNARGQAIRLIGKNGRTVSFEYDASGNETALTYSDAGRFESEFDAAGHKVTERLPSGATIRSEYDARGKLAWQSDSRGRSINITRDASGEVAELSSSSGGWVRAERDGAGRVIALTNSSGKTRRFAYDARGSLVGYTDARGRHSAFAYDRRGRLRSVADSEGVSLRLDYDRAGRLVAARRVEPPRGAAQFLRASLLTLAPFPRPLAQGGVGCTFGGGDGWYEGDTFNSDFGMGCGDPLGGFGNGFGGGGGFDPLTDWNSRGQCYDCQKRELDICRYQLDAELRTVLAGSLGLEFGCLAWVAIPWRYFTCLASALAANGLLNGAARDRAEACKLNMRKTCESVCPGIIW
jgi:YD repeat-containing protein